MLERGYNDLPKEKDKPGKSSPFKGLNRILENTKKKKNK